MTECNVQNRTIFCDDNLDVMRGINSECIDLIYLDPPFNKNKEFTAPIGTSAEGAGFKDIFRKEDVKYEWLTALEQDQPELYQYLNGIRGVGKPYNFAYLAYMAIRLIECHRILKPTGSVFLHCDATMSHYLKVAMDSIFQETNFLSDITWKRYAAHSLSSSCVDTISEQLLYYAKDRSQAFANTVLAKLSESKLLSRFKYIEKETQRRYQHVALEQSSNRSSAGETRIINGKEIKSDVGWRWSQETFDERLRENPHLIYWTKTGRPRYKLYMDEFEGSPVGNIWTDVNYLASGAKERVNVNYATQKPLDLLNRIILACSKPNDIILDPFCGCATTCVAAERLERQWIGIDISVKAYELVKARLTKEAADPEDLLKYKNQIHMKTDPPRRTDLEVDYREKKFVYVISHPAYPSEYKVGIAKNWKSRLNSFQTSDPDREYKIEFHLETPHFRETEVYIHSKFPNKHEWVQGDLNEIIKEIREFRSAEAQDHHILDLFGDKPELSEEEFDQNR